MDTSNLVCMAESDSNQKIDKAIIANNLSKQFGKIEAVRNLSFEVNRGELFGIIGPDGAGKTTLFRMLTSLMQPNSGDAYVDGLHTVKDYKQIDVKIDDLT